MGKGATSSESEADTLRRAAEARLSESTQDHDTQHVLHELQVHQIELEMQNEALRSAQLALEDSRARYHDLFEFAPVGYLKLTCNGIIRKINRAAVCMLGVEREQALDRRLVAFVANDDRDRCHVFLRQLGAAPAGKKIKACELKLQRLDGTPLPTRLSGAAASPGQGGFALRVTLTDLSESRQLAALNESETRLRLAVEAIPGGLYDWHRGVDSLYWNSSYIDACTFGKRGFTPRRCWWRDRIHPEDLQRVRRTLIKAIREGKRQFSVEYRLRFDDGEWCHVLDRGHILRDAKGRIERFVGTLTDISTYIETAQRQARINEMLEDLVVQRTTQIEARTRALAESERFARETMDSIDIRLCVLDERGTVITTNKAWREFEASEIACAHPKHAGGHRLQPYGMSCWAPATRDKVSQAVSDMLAGRRDAFSFEYECASEHESRWFEMFITRFAGDGPTRLVIRHKETTERKLAELEQRHAAQRIKQMVRHADSMSEARNAAVARELHDELGASLTMLKLGLATLAEKQHGEAPQDTFAALIEQADNALKVTRRISGSLRPPVLDTLGLVAAIKSHMAQFSLTTGIGTTLRPARERIQLSDAANIAVFRIVQEALTNVAKHARASHVVVNARRHHDTMIVRIVDDGSGIPEDALQRPDAFGIVGMRERIQHLGGTLSIGARPLGSGTRLTLRVPIDGASGVPAGPPARSAANTPAQRKYTV